MGNDAAHVQLWLGDLWSGTHGSPNNRRTLVTSNLRKKSNIALVITTFIFCVCACIFFLFYFNIEIFSECPLLVLVCWETFCCLCLPFEAFLFFPRRWTNGVWLKAGMTLILQIWGFKSHQPLYSLVFRGGINHFISSVEIIIPKIA